MHQNLAEKDAPEADIAEALLDAGLDDLTEKEYQSLKSKHNTLFRLYNATKSFMAPLLIPTEYIRFNSKKPNTISVGEEDAIPVSYTHLRSGRSESVIKKLPANYCG